MSQPTLEFEIMASTALPDPCSPESPGRRPWNAVTCGYRAQRTRYTRTASGVRPDSTPELVRQGADETPPELEDDAEGLGLLVDR
jgi:hypothetical protein